MATYIRLVRYPYEEPHHLNLVLTASNGRIRGQLEFYVNAHELTQWAEAMETFPLHTRSTFLWEFGSERAEDRYAYYFRMRLFTVDSKGHGAIQFRLNNNEELPKREISEFCIESDPAPINRLGQLLRAFADLKHEVLEWSPISGQLFESLEDPEQEFSGTSSSARQPSVQPFPR